MERRMSIAAQARKAGLRPATVVKRLEYGYTLEEALTKPVRKRTGAAAGARANHMNPHTVRSRMKRGYSLSEALRPEPRKRPTGCRRHRKKWHRTGKNGMLWCKLCNSEKHKRYYARKKEERTCSQQVRTGSKSEALQG